MRAVSEILMFVKDKANVSISIVSMIMLLFQFLLAELNTFYLKFVLWIPPEHYINLTRLVFFLFMGAAALREVFQYLDDPYVFSVQKY